MACPGGQPTIDIYQDQGGPVVLHTLTALNLKFHDHARAQYLDRYHQAQVASTQNA